MATFKFTCSRDDTMDSHKSKYRSIIRVLAKILLKNSSSSVILLCGLSIIASVLPGTQIYLTRRVINDVAYSSRPSTVFSSLLMFAVCMMFSIVCSSSLSYVSSRISSRISLSSNAAVINKISIKFNAQVKMLLIVYLEWLARFVAEFKRYFQWLV